MSQSYSFSSCKTNINNTWQSLHNQIKSFSFSSSLKEEGAKEQQHSIGSRRGM